MKLAKLSLAAVVAAGSFSMANAAVSFEEAIKDVELSGMMRYRLDGVRNKTEFAKEDIINEHENINKFRAEINAGVKFDENFSGNFGLRFDANDTNSHNHGGPVLNASKDDGGANDIIIREVNFVYKNADFANLTVKAGRQKVDTLYTAGIVGDGVLATVAPMEGLTLAGFYFANLDGHDSNSNIRTIHQPLYGVGVLTDFDIVTADLWAAQLKDTATVFGLDAGTEIALDDSMKVTAKAQVSQTSVDSEMKPSLQNSTNFNVNVGFDAGMFNAKVGFAMTGTDKGGSLVTLHDSGAFETMGEIVMDFDGTNGENTFIYAGVGAKLDAFSAGFEYVNAKTGKLKDMAGNETKWNEFVGRLGYKYNDKLSFSGFYAYAQDDADNKETENKFRVEAKYQF